MKKHMPGDYIIEGLKDTFGKLPAAHEVKKEEQETKQIKPKGQAEKPKVKSDSMIASTEASMLDSMIENIRRAVRKPGSRVSFARLTEEEKSLLEDIAYTYKRQGIKTSENEIVRVAINYLILDYQTNGQTSILARVIAALNA